MNLNGLIDNMMSKTDQLIALVQKRDEWLYELDEAEGIDPTSDDAWDETAIEDRRHDIVLLNEDIDAMIAEMADEQVNPCEITADATPDNWEVCDEVAAMLDEFYMEQAGPKHYQRCDAEWMGDSDEIHDTMTDAGLTDDEPTELAVEPTGIPAARDTLAEAKDHLEWNQRRRAAANTTLDIEEADEGVANAAGFVREARRNLDELEAGAEQTPDASPAPASLDPAFTIVGGMFDRLTVRKANLITARNGDCDTLARIRQGDGGEESDYVASIATFEVRIKHVAAQLDVLQGAMNCLWTAQAHTPPMDDPSQVGQRDWLSRVSDFELDEHLRSLLDKQSAVNYCGQLLVKHALLLTTDIPTMNQDTARLSDLRSQRIALLRISREGLGSVVEAIRKELTARSLRMISYDGMNSARLDMEAKERGLAAADAELQDARHTGTRGDAALALLRVKQMEEDFGRAAVALHRAELAVADLNR